MSSQAMLATTEVARARVSRRPALMMAAVVGAVLALGAASTDGFLTVDNGRAILANMAILGIVAAGMTCITLGGNLFSLTLGSTVAVTTMAFLAALDFGTVPAIVLTVACGGAICAVQGLAVGALGANPIIVTIAFGALQLGVAGKLTNEATVYPPEGASYRFLADTVAGLPVAVFVLVGVVALLELWLRRSRLGQETYLVGENRAAAYAAPLRVTRVTVAAFGIAGACAAIGGILIGASEGNATLLSGGDRYTFDAIAAVLVGGAAVAGGRGSPARTVLGALFIAAISDMLLLRGYNDGVQVLVTGVVVLSVLVMMRLRRDGPA